MVILGDEDCNGDDAGGGGSGRVYYQVINCSNSYSPELWNG